MNVAFHSDATNLVSGDTNSRGDIFVHDMQSGDTARVSVSAIGTQSNLASFYPAISSDGRYISFNTPSSNLTASDTELDQDVFRAPNPLYVSP